MWSDIRACSKCALYLAVVAAVTPSIAGCRFDPAGFADGDDDDGAVIDGSITVIDAMVDAPDIDAPMFDAAAPFCEPNLRTCSNRTLRICNQTGSGLDNVECPFTCEPNEGDPDGAYCSVASNLPEADQMACGRGLVPQQFFPSANATVDIDKLGVFIRCEGQGCGNGMTEVRSAGTFDDGTAWFCLSEFVLSRNRTLSTSRALPRPVVFFVTVDAFIAGTIDFTGAAAAGAAGGAAGPGGGAGAPIAADNGGGQPGLGDCPGGGGVRNGAQGGSAAGGGGGGGNRSAGGSGGTGMNNVGDLGAGGPPGGNCHNGNATLEPLVGGSGGGSGGDGCLDSNCSGSGGGGGGAIQIAALGSINVNGLINASGGNNAVDNGSRGGGGGGGAGGAILLEASEMSIGADALQVDGGSGANAGSRGGGIGARDNQASGAAGGSATANNEGGAGGGGGGGIIRLNATRINDALPVPNCDADQISPNSACTAAELKRADAIVGPAPSTHRP